MLMQIMSMGAGLYMPSVMLPTGMQQMHPAQMAHFASIGVGMGMGMGYRSGMLDMNGGSSGYPMIPVPSVQGAHYAGSAMPGPTSFHGMAGYNLKMLGHHGPGVPMSMPCASFIPVSGGYYPKSNAGAGHIGNLGSTSASSVKNPMLDINSQAMQNAGANSSVNQTSDQVH